MTGRFLGQFMCHVNTRTHAESNTHPRTSRYPSYTHPSPRSTETTRDGQQQQQKGEAQVESPNRSPNTELKQKTLIRITSRKQEKANKKSDSRNHESQILTQNRNAASHQTIFFHLKPNGTTEHAFGSFFRPGRATQPCRHTA